MALDVGPIYYLDPMADPAAMKAKLLALKALGVGEFAHLNGTLESHLMGTYRLLREWERPGYVCDAGLYHAVYGTQPLAKLGIPHKEYSPADRPGIRDVIGEESERLVYLYGACDREFFYPRIGAAGPVYRDRFTGERRALSAETMRDLLEITLANELEICLASPSFMETNRSGYRDLFDRFRPFVSAKPFERYLEAFAVPSPVQG